MFKVWYITDFAGQLLAKMDWSFDKLPNPLPWIEPSINCLHQEAVLSLMVGNYQCAIISMCSLMEHVLRLAIINKDKCGYGRTETIAQLDKYQKLSQLIDEAEGTIVFSQCDVDWWRAVSKNIRNKTAHYLLPTILRNCASDPKLKQYISEDDLPKNNQDWHYEHITTDWGAFYHSSGQYFTIRFLNDATEQLRNIIDKTSWAGDESWWISLKESYDMFFSYDWSVENIKKSFEDVYKER